MPGSLSSSLCLKLLLPATGPWRSCWAACLSVTQSPPTLVSAGAAAVPSWGNPCDGASGSTCSISLGLVKVACHICDWDHLDMAKQWVPTQLCQLLAVARGAIPPSFLASVSFLMKQSVMVVVRIKYENIEECRGW